MKNAHFLLTLPVFTLCVAACVRSRADQDAGAPPPVTSATAAPNAAPSAAPSGTGFTVAQCESLLIDAERKLAAERSRAASDCKADGDCQLVETSACIPACSDRAIAKKAVDGYQKQREQLRQSNCKLWNDAECARTTPKPQPDCPPMKAVCKAGHCDAVPKTDAK